MNNDEIKKIANSISEDIAMDNEGHSDNEIIVEILGEIDDINASLKSVIFNLYRIGQRGDDVNDIINNIPKSLREYITMEIRKLTKLEHGTTP